MNTPGRAQPFPGPKLYQRRAAEALPILVKQAQRQKEISYGDLARQMGINNARVLNYVLGSIGSTLVELGKEWGTRIPPIQAITVNAATRLPGSGGQWFVGGKKLQARTPREKRRVIEQAFDKIFAYPDWPRVLAALELEPTHKTPDALIDQASNMRGRGGESKAHRNFKKKLAANPTLVGLRGRWTVQTEAPLPSGDRVDVLFTKAREIVAVEVKSHISPPEDIMRGLFQCLKYRVVLEAKVAVAETGHRVRSLLALEGGLSSAHLETQAALGIEVIEFDRQ